MQFLQATNILSFYVNTWADYIRSFFMYKQVCLLTLGSNEFYEVEDYILNSKSKDYENITFTTASTNNPIIGKEDNNDKCLKMFTGICNLNFKGAIINIVSQINQDVKDVGHHLILSTWTWKKSNVILNFLKHAQLKSAESRKNSIRVYEYDSKMECWRISRTREDKNLKSVIINKDVQKDFVDDILSFCSKESCDWYKKYSISYKRGYLLSGPPGTGKSSLITAVASKLEKHVCFVQIALNNMTDKLLLDSFSEIPRNSVLVLEDIDSIFDSISGKKEHVQVTFSGLLNALDGINDLAGRIIFMTTNHLSRLDKALIRPGRVDKVVKVDYANDLQIKGMFEKFYVENATEELCNIFLKNVKAKIFDKKVTTAEIQKYFIDAKSLSAQEASKCDNFEKCLSESKAYENIYN